MLPRNESFRTLIDCLMCTIKRVHDAYDKETAYDKWFN